MPTWVYKTSQFCENKHSYHTVKVVSLTCYLLERIVFCSDSNPLHPQQMNVLPDLINTQSIYGIKLPLCLCLSTWSTFSMLPSYNLLLDSIFHLTIIAIGINNSVAKRKYPNLLKFGNGFLLRGKVCWLRVTALNLF